MSAGSLRVLIPGGTGYVGGRIAEHLASQGMDVCVCSRRAGPWAGPTRSIAVREADWRDPTQLDQLVDGRDAIIMLAAANEIDAAADPVAAADATSTQCVAWLEAAARAGVSRFVYFSTIHVYGANDGSRLHESREPRPVHPYASTHLAAEVYVQAAHRQGKLNAVIFRLSNAYGAPVDPAVKRWTLLVNDLARQAVLDGRLRLRSDGLQARDFVGLRQVCAAVHWSLQDRPRGAEAAILNLGSGVSETVYDMAQRVSRRARLLWPGEFPVLRPAPTPDATAPPFCLDISRLADAGFAVSSEPDVEIDELLRFCHDHALHLSPA